MDSFLLGALSMFVGLYILASLSVGDHETGQAREQQALTRGYAVFCGPTGEFSWKGECEQ